MRTVLLLAALALLPAVASAQEPADITPDQAQAELMRRWRQAAEQGDASAQNNLGFAYATGEGVPQDDAEAVRWFRLAAEQSHAGAQYSLGVIYGAGEGAAGRR